MVEDEAQVLKVEDRVDIRDDLLAEPLLLAAIDLQPVLPVSNLCDLCVNSLVLFNESAGVEIEQVQLKMWTLVLCYKETIGT